MLTVRKLRYFTSAAAASLVLVAATGDNFADQVSSTSEFVRTAQTNTGVIIGGPGSVIVTPPPSPVNNTGVIIGGPGPGNIGGGSTNSPSALGGGSTYRPR